MTKKKKSKPAQHSPTANEYLVAVEQRRQRVLQRMKSLPVATLVWGPSPDGDSPVCRTRLILRDSLRQNGHVSHFSEELYDPHAGESNFAQQLSQLEAYDIVFSIPDSFGSIAEIHDFAKLPGLGHKIVTFLDRQWHSGYANQSIVETRAIVTSDIQMYDAATLPACVVGVAMDMVNRLQLLHYTLGRR